MSETMLKKLLEPYPLDIQIRFRETVDKLQLKNPDDPIFELMLVLGQWGKCYHEISEKIKEAGQHIEGQNEAALRSLDERVRMLQGLAQAIQQATDRLSSAGAEIVEKLPVEEIAHQVTDRINKTINKLPIEKLQTIVTTTDLQMSTVRTNSLAAISELNEVSRKLKSVADQINEIGLTGITILYTGMGMMIGAMIVALLKLSGWIWR